MESADFTTEELEAERVRAMKMATLCRSHGEHPAASTHDATQRACVAELVARGAREE